MHQSRNEILSSDDQSQFKFNYITNISQQFPSQLKLQHYSTLGWQNAFKSFRDTNKTYKIIFFLINRKKMKALTKCIKTSPKNTLLIKWFSFSLGAKQTHKKIGKVSKPWLQRIKHFTSLLHPFWYAVAKL